MTYDVHLVRPAPGAEPADLARALLAREDSDADPGPLSPEAEAWKQSLADALQKLDARLVRYTPDPVALARFLEIPVEEARRRNRAVEIATPEEGSGMAVTLYDDGATLCMPFHLSPGPAAHAWREAFSCMKVLAHQGGLVPYDPQLERVLDLNADIGPVLDRYGAGEAAAAARSAARNGAPDGAKRPWWRFW